MAGCSRHAMLEPMPMVMVLVDHKGMGMVQRGLPDPHGGTFDAAGDFDRLLVPYSDVTSPMWRYIDPDGDTLFNRLQMPPFRDELERLRSVARDGPERRG